jgi:peptidoglycan/xylan/chitin deacetylase (PgdA/CDA1 family)
MSGRANPLFKPLEKPVRKLSVRLRTDTRRAGKRALFATLATLGAVSVCGRRLTRAGACLVLNVHSVSPANNPFWPALKPSEFEALLFQLTPHVYFATFATYQEALARKPARPVVVLSFDDGYRDFVDYAMPILAKHRVRANLNIITDAIESGNVPWNVDLYERLNQCSDAELDLLHLPGFDGARALARGGRPGFGLALARLLKNRTQISRNELLAGLWEQLSPARQPGRTMMSVRDVGEVHSEHELGLHSDAHESMRFESDAFFVADFRQCAERFRRWTGTAASIYAFPNGSYRNRQVQWLGEQGIEHVLLVDECVEREPYATYTVWPRTSLRGQSDSERLLESLGIKSRLAGSLLAGSALTGLRLLEWES